MANTVQNERIEMRVSPEIKLLAERASSASGCASLTEYLTRLIMEHAPLTLQRENVIKLTNAQYDNFIKVCEDTERKPSERILNAAKRLDTEGY